MEVLNDLLNYSNLKIYQNTEMFSFSLDSVLLPNFVTLNKNIKKVLDIGSGNAAIPLILTTKTDAKITGIEIQEESYYLGKKSIEYNQLEDKIEFINDDVKEYAKKIESDTFDTITCNPPYFKVNDKSRFNDSDYKTIARHEIKLNLEELFKIAKKLLKNNGNIAIVHRPERLIDIIEEMKKNNIEPKKVQFVYPGVEKQANILLIEGIKNGKPGLKILKPIYSHLENGEYTDEIKKFFQ